MVKYEWVKQNADLWKQAGYTLEEISQLTKDSMINNLDVGVTAEESSKTLKEAMDKFADDMINSGILDNVSDIGINEKQLINYVDAINQVVWSREQKIEFLLAGEKELGLKYSDKYGDFSNVSDEDLNDMVEELDWLWK